MATRTRDLFLTVRTEGAILPADLLQRIVDPKTDLGGLTPDAYHLPKGEKITEATNRAWNRLLGIWSTFRTAAEALPEGEPGTTVTRERWLLPLFQELGYGRLLTTKAIEIDGKTYPISHGWNRAPIHLLGCRVDLDRPTQRLAGASRSSPHSLLQELLNRSHDHLWGFVSNGLRLRILRDNVSLTRQAFVEFDLEAMMLGENYSDFVLLWLLCHQSRVEAENPSECWLEKWSQASKERGVRALDQLRQGVEKSITALGRGFLACATNRELRERLRTGSLDAQDYYRQVLRLVYRLLFLFAAEDREVRLLLPGGEHAAARERYLRFYSTTRLRRLAERRSGTRHTDLYISLRLVMQKLGSDAGCTELALPALGSFLFSGQAMPDIENCDLANHDLLDAIRALAVTVADGVWRSVDYKNLGAEELGSVYESLLELHPRLNLDAPSFELDVASGHERKTTGSYYTPTSLIDCLLDSALDPALDVAAKQANPEQAILKMRVADPACGSGHFLIAAAYRIAKRLATVRTGDDEPSPDATHTALRDVIGHCVYGVDINPMAVELCKVNLWMEALEPGKPLSFLEHRIQCGDALLGATQALMDKGIPDAAFTPIEGDDRGACTKWKKVNKAERVAWEKKLQWLGFDAPWTNLGNFAQGLMVLDNLADDSITGIRQKERLYEQAIRSSDYLDGKFLADAWCAAFVWKKVSLTEFPITEEVYRQIERNPAAFYHDKQAMAAEIRWLARQYHFFHWHLAFPDIFRPPGKIDEADSQPPGWNGGFDVVVGNPPWIRQELLKNIKNLLMMYEAYSGTADLSVYFLQRSVQILCTSGRVGMLTPNKWFVAEYGRQLRIYMRSATRVQLVIDFGHSKSLFPGADTFPAAVTAEKVDHPVGAEQPLMYLKAEDRERTNNSLDHLVQNAAVVVRHEALTPERWQLGDSKITSLINRLSSVCVPLAQVVGKQLFRGVLTGFNDAFVIDERTRRRLTEADHRSAEVIKPWLNGRDLRRWRPRWDGQYIIFTKRGIDLALYPAIADHLSKWHEDLTPKQHASQSGPGRKPGKYKWYEIQDNVAYYEEFEHPKFVFQEIAFHAQFAYEAEGLYCNKRVHIIPSSDLYVVAILNSRLGWWLLNHLMPKMKDGALLLQGSLMGKFPIPNVPSDLRGEISGYVAQILESQETASAGELLEIEKAISRLVEMAYCLSETEISAVRDSLPPRDPLLALEAAAIRRRE